MGHFRSQENEDDDDDDEDDDDDDEDDDDDDEEGRRRAVWNWDCMIVGRKNFEQAPAAARGDRGPRLKSLPP